ncbi:4-hydroxyphenylpyruvate dioxygenase [Methylibium rhizosphaerae]|uniref:4-hydroxyphenylpyruvate dioxygenase n=1 Tax=Methylibium rhizosphaerae TaxID=2570323 RepID=UPI00112A894A|nr:4-hydroxyphenylpyruvate dioxygenase [Methylibium rhizosphaerae]
MSPTSLNREGLGETPNPLGLAGIEYVEYVTAKPQALGHTLERMGFRPVARHRSREVLLYRQGGMNIVVNAHHGVLRGSREPTETPRISALALRVQDARAAYERVLSLGAWDVPMHAQVMELNIPGIHGPSGAHIYFVDRWRDFSIYDVDFVPIPTVEQHPPALAGLRWFGVVQYVGRERTDDWVRFYGDLLGLTLLPAGQRFGIMPKGALMKSPCGLFYLQLVEPHPATLAYDEQEEFERIGLGAADVPAAVAALRANGVEFEESPNLKVTERGALTRHVLQSVTFELVHDERGSTP